MVPMIERYLKGFSKGEMRVVIMAPRGSGKSVFWKQVQPIPIKLWLKEA